MEDIEKNIKAIEEEKKEYLASKDVLPRYAPSTRTSDEVPSVKEDINTEGKEHPEDSEDIAPKGVPSDMQDGTGEGKDGVETEVDVLEFDLDDEEINELMEKLRELKETKTSFNFEVDDENELLINYAPEGVPSNEGKESKNDTEY
ncbi:hypothetical protein KAT80_02530 [Candidatus Pacearchaeota archaeon]|nr:hypothetical protein [Candidatus Pacearchaeota archaeon]